MPTSLFCSHCGNKETVLAKSGPVTFPCSSCGWMTTSAPADSGNLPALTKMSTPHFTFVRSEPEGEIVVDQIYALLGGILKTMKEKHAEARRINLDLKNLEYQAGAIGEWLANEEKQKEMAHAARTIPDLQYRLFDRLQTLKPGTIEVVNGAAVGEESLSVFIAAAFEAFGWTVNLIEQPLESRCGEEITFVVGTDPITYGVAAIHLALLGAGFRIYSQTSAEQSSLIPRLHVHRLSNVPRLLPAIKTRVAQEPFHELRKSA